MTREIASIPMLVTATVTAGLGIACLVNNRRSALNVYLGLLNLSITAWVIDLFLLKNATDLDTANLISRIFRPSIFLVAVFFYKFIELQTRDLIPWTRRVGTVITWLAGAGILLNILGIGYGGCIESSLGGYAPRLDATYVLFVLTAILATAGSVTAMVIKHNSEKVYPIEKQQIRYFFAASVILTTGAATNLLKLGGFQVYPLGNEAVILYTCLVTYAMLSYNLLNLREMVQKASVYAAIALQILVILAVVNFYILGSPVAIEYELTVNFAIILLIVLAFGPTLALIEKLTRRIFLISKPDYQQLLRQILTDARYIKEIDRLFESISMETALALRLTKASVFLRNREKDIYEGYGGGGSFSSAEIAGVVRYLEVNHGLTYAKRLKDSILYRLTGIPDAVQQEVYCFMEKESAEIIFPIFMNNEISGFWVVGEKTGKETFSKEDELLIMNIASQGAVIAESIFLYNQLMDSERLVVLGKMAAAVAHEIRNPITGLSNYIQMLNRKGSRDKELTERFLQIAPREIKRIENLTDNLLALGHSGSVVLTDEDICDIARETIMFFEHTFSKKSIRTAVNVAAEKKLKVDRKKVTQAMFNIILNAIQAMPDGGELSVSCREVKTGGQKYFALEMADTGMGFDEKISERVFEPFFTTKSEGTGLGLPICKNIMELHKGLIEIKSALGQGTVVRLLFPENNQGG